MATARLAAPQRLAPREEVEIFGEEYIKVMNHIGITDLVRSEWLFKGNMNKDV